MDTPDEVLKRAAALFQERNAVYRNNYRDMGPTLVAFFPGGLTLRTAEDFIRFHLFMLMIVKLTRYTNNWATGHSDSLMDAAAYAGMLESVDQEMRALEVRLL